LKVNPQVVPDGRPISSKCAVPVATTWFRVSVATPLTVTNVEPLVGDAIDRLWLLDVQEPNL